jgi:phosphoglucosamine mutase
MSLFGTSGIRGVVNEDITTELCRQVGQALGTSLAAGATVAVATDTRVSREILKEAVVSGLLLCGVDVADLGILPTPVLALLTREWAFDAGIMVTASHNPPEFNGIKFFNRDSIGFSVAQEQEIERLYHQKEFREGHEGTLSQAQGMKESYLRFVEGRLPVGSLNTRIKTVVDPGNGAASGFVSDLFARLGLRVFTVNDTPDGLFPGRDPEPREDTLRGTVQFLKDIDADLAVCFDGDADRVVFCDREGFLGFNEATAFISRLVVETSGAKTIASTVESGRLLDLAVEDLGVEVVRGKVGDVHLAHLTRDANAAIGTEQVGVYIIPHVGYYPDSIFAALTLLSGIDHVSEIRDFFSRIPGPVFDKGKVSCPNQFKQAVMARVKEGADHFGAKHVNALDGVRLEFDESWMLIRASGTEPVIRVIAESMAPSTTAELLRAGVQVVQSIVDEYR